MIKKKVSNTSSTHTSLLYIFNNSLEDAEKTLIVFGSYKEGVNEIIEREGRKAVEMFDYILNMIPNQGTETVRTEEAVISTLAILNTI